MTLTPLSFRAQLADYDTQAATLLEAFEAGDREALELFWRKHPRFLDEQIRWLPKRLSEEDVRRAPLDHADARLALARWYDFESWARLVEHVEQMARPGSAAAIFESAVEAVIDGDRPVLEALLRDHPELIRARSTRVTPFDPPVHGATLLHYVAANGVEGYRQRTPPNIVQIGKTLLTAGAEVDAFANIYGGQVTTMSMVVSSSPPAAAGLQVPLVDLLVEFGSDVEGKGSGPWVSPLMTALAFGFHDAARALLRHGARVRTLAAAAGLGLLDDARRLLAGAAAEDRHRALALAAQHGHTDIVALLLDTGEDPNRYNPDGIHSHATPLHQAVWADHVDVVRLLVERGARLDIKDTIYQGTPLGWAEYGGRGRIAAFLRSQQPNPPGG